jgi:hypothetical protein
VRENHALDAPSRPSALPRELQPLLDDLLRVRSIAEETVRWVGGFEMPDLTYDHELVALARPDEYAVVGGHVVSSAGLDVTVDAFFDHFVVRALRPAARRLRPPLCRGAPLEAGV